MISTQNAYSIKPCFENSTNLQQYKILIVMQEHTLHSQKDTNILKHQHLINNSTFSKVRLARMHTAMQRFVDRGWAPGLITLVHRHGREYVDVLGNMTFNSNVPMQRDTIFRLASMT